MLIDILIYRNSNVASPRVAAHERRRHYLPDVAPRGGLLFVAHVCPHAVINHLDAALSDAV